MTLPRHFFKQKFDKPQANDTIRFGKPSRQYSAREYKLILAMKFGDAPELAAQLDRTAKAITSRKAFLKIKPVVAVEEKKKPIIVFARPAWFSNENIGIISKYSGNRIKNSARDKASAS